MFEITKKLNGETIESKTLPNMSQVWNCAREWRNGLTAEQIGQKAEFIVHDSEDEEGLKDLLITAKAGKNGKVLMMNSNPTSRRSVQDRAKKAAAKAAEAAAKAAEETAKAEADKIAAEEAKRAKRREYDRKRREAKKAAAAA